MIQELFISKYLKNIQNMKIQMRVKITSNLALTLPTCNFCNIFLSYTCNDNNFENFHF